MNSVSHSISLFPAGSTTSPTTFANDATKLNSCYQLIQDQYSGTFYAGKKKEKKKE
jgi:hypothetical protein